MDFAKTDFGQNGQVMQSICNSGTAGMVIACRKVVITVRLPESPAALDRWVRRLDKSWLVTIVESERTPFWLKCIWTLDPKRLVHLSFLLPP